MATLVAGIGCAWLANALIVVREREAMVPLFYDNDFCLRAVGTPGYHNGARVPLLRRMLGDDPIDVLFYEPAADPDGKQLRRAQRVFPETEIWGWPLQAEETLPNGIRSWPKDRHFMI